MKKIQNNVLIAALKPLTNCENPSITLFRKLVAAFSIAALKPLTPSIALFRKLVSAFRYPPVTLKVVPEAT